LEVIKWYLKGVLKTPMKIKLVSLFSNEVGHYLWLQGPFNHLSRERRVSYFVAVLR
jgi:hypothetical protein